ncbi:MAG: metal ABC transporter permease [Acidobacteriota bacterium]
MPEWFQLPFMVQALVACAAMGVLLAYLGIHVVGRGIVFVDLGLGQISSMGVAYAMYSGRDPVTCSMIFTLLGAAIFSRLRVHDPRLRLEAVIGIFYAVASAVTVLLIAKTPHGDADIQDVLFGNVLALDVSQIKKMLLVFGLVAVFHAVLGKRFFELTYKKGKHETLSSADHFMNFLFYVSLAFAIVFAIRAGGVIPVFSYLIVPAVAGILMSRHRVVVVLMALGIALAASFLGLHLSFAYDFPAGASIVTMLGAFALFAAIVALLGALVRGRAKAAAGATVAATILLMARPAGAVEASKTPATATIDELRAEIATLKSQVESSNARIATIEAELEKLAQTPVPVPAPALPPPAAAGGGGGLRLIDISLDGLFAAAASTAPEDEMRTLNAGGHDPKNRGVTLQNLELTLAGAVDPYMRGDANIVMQITPEGESSLEVEEAYLTTLALPGSLQLKAGQFFASFGRLNPSHPHTWDFADQPVISSRMFGGDGLRGPGAQLSWLLPTPFFAEATLGVQNANGETAFSFRSVPGEDFGGRTLLDTRVDSAGDLLYLGRFGTSFDLSDTFTIVPGVSYVTGPNATGAHARTDIGGVDFYAKWKPLSNDHGWPFFAFQSEVMHRSYDAAEQIDELGTVLPAETLKDDGGYAQALWGFKRRWVAGLRFDWAGGNGDSALDPLRDARRRLSSDVTFYPSEFSKLRFQVNRDRADHLLEDETSVFLQFEYLYGAHGGHKF